MKLRILVAQLNLLVGDISGNCDRIVAAARTARDRDQADLVVFPELALTGYPPEDLLLRPELIARVEAALEALCAQTQGIALVVGYPRSDLGGLYNAAGLVVDGRIIAEYAKQRLPNYSVFDEKRYFRPGSAPSVCDFKGVRLGLSVCEDIWEEGPTEQAAEAGAAAPDQHQRLALPRGQGVRAGVLGPAACLGARTPHRLRQPGGRPG